jgi:hypothetical protein
MPDTVVFRGLTQAQANATAQFHRDSGATSAKIIPEGALFSVEVTYPDDPASVPKAEPTPAPTTDTDPTKPVPGGLHAAPVTKVDPTLTPTTHTDPTKPVPGGLHAAPVTKVDPTPSPSIPTDPTKPVPGGLHIDHITHLAQIMHLARISDIARFRWANRGSAPPGYIKGMALVYGRVYSKFKAGHAAALDMARKNTGNSDRDALAWYDDVFSAAGMDNSTSGVDTLRHLFVLLIGLGMRESSGRYCVGRDTTANNVTADTAEAGLFQVSFNAKGASPLLPQIFAHYRANPFGFLDVFKEGVICSASNLENFGHGDGKEFQRLCKECPAFAAEFAAVALRHLRKHWGPINRKEAQVRPECDALLRQVQAAIDASSALGSALVALA